MILQIEVSIQGDERSAEDIEVIADLVLAIDALREDPRFVSLGNISITKISFVELALIADRVSYKRSQQTRRR